VTENQVNQFTLDELRTIFQNVGYRVEEVIDPVTNLPYLRSATGGLGFEIRPGNRLASDPEAFIDVVLIAILQVQGELPLEIVNRWNATRRFARLQLSQPFLALSLDVSVAGGVSASHLRAQIQIWDHLIQQLITYLREELQKLPAERPASAAVREAAPIVNEMRSNAAVDPRMADRVQ
jgi:Putative bacterial sensory transduction regulator